jgi:hypothetical protein
MDVTNQNGLHGLLLVVAMVARDRPKLLKCICCVEGEECSLESYLLAQHLCKKELGSRFVANFVDTPSKIFKKIVFYPLKNSKHLNVYSSTHNSILQAKSVWDYKLLIFENPPQSAGKKFKIKFSFRQNSIWSTWKNSRRLLPSNSGQLPFQPAAV